MSALRNERYFIHPSRALLRMRVCMGYRPSMRHGPLSGSIATGTSSTPLRSGRLQAAVGAHRDLVRMDTWCRHPCQHSRCCMAPVHANGSSALISSRSASAALLQLHANKNKKKKNEPYVQQRRPLSAHASLTMSVCWLGKQITTFLVVLQHQAGHAFLKPTSQSFGSRWTAKGRILIRKNHKKRGLAAA